MRLSLVPLPLLPLLFIASQNPLRAIDVNCDSPVWRTNELCVDKKLYRKSIQYGGWFPFGFNKKGKAVNWTQLLSLEKLNQNSFRLKSKFISINNDEIEGKLDINCKNKDYYIRPIGVMSQRGTWARIPKGSGIEILSQYLCKRTNAKDLWGYTERTSYLWETSTPSGKPSNASGEWVQHSDGLGWYNTEIRKEKNSVVYAYFSTSQTKRPYFWVNNSCLENLRSVFFQPNNYVEGEWLSPKRGRPGGVNETIVRTYCK